MGDFPWGMMAYGFADTFIEPFCYGCAAFILFSRICKVPLLKVLAIACGVLAFLWMDDIWFRLVSNQAQMAWSSGDENTLRWMSYVGSTENLGTANFNSGEQSELRSIWKISSNDILSALFFVPLGYWVGILVTRRTWNELKDHSIAESNSVPLKQSRLGIASFILSLISGIIIVGLAINAAVIYISSPEAFDDDSVGIAIMGLLMLLMIVFEVVALGLGIAGLVQHNKKKTYATIGTALSAMIIFGLIIMAFPDL